MDNYEISKKVINDLSEKLNLEWKAIKWELPHSVGKDMLILKGVEIHAQIQLLYKIIHDIEWAIKENEKTKC